MIRVYGIKNCDSVKKAIKFLKAHDLAYTLIDFKETPMGCDKINTWRIQTDIKTLFNTRSTTYRTLGLKALNLTDEEKVQWLCKENILIKRPVIEYDNKLIVGFNSTQYKGAFLS
ncbi:MAG: arsenate reductase family protein [Epsilonproteobacteria bacterium]|nr:MAG: arsenate reductase family protein [Campylobacterota bacterium]